MQKQRLLALATGLVAGGALSFFYRLVHAAPFGYSGHSYWGWQAYETSLVLAGLGLAGLLRSEWRWAPLGIAAGAVLTEGVPDFFRELNAPFHDTAPPMIFFVVLIEPLALIVLSLPAAFAGAAAGNRLTRTRIPHFVYAMSLVIALGVVASLVVIDGRIRNELETKTLPDLLTHIYQAETAYSAGAADKSFTCDPSQFPAVRDLGWLVVRPSDFPPGAIIPRKAHVWMTHRYNVALDCGEIGLHFDAMVMRTGGGALMYIDESGELLHKPDLEGIHKKRIETREIPALLERVYQAEVAYRAAQPDKAFTCDGGQLPGLTTLRWSPQNVLHVDYYTATLDCMNETRPRRLRITAEYGTPQIVSISMDETGKIAGRPVRD